MSDRASKHLESIAFQGRTLTLESGEVARQADGAVVLRDGQTMILATVVAERTGKHASEFIPLTVEYRERMSATGRLPGGYQKRETRMGDHEVLTSRLIDRALRPLLPSDFGDELQVLVTVYGAEPKADLDLLSLLAASAALHVSDVPFAGPLAATRIADEGLDCLAATTREGYVMLEGGANELAPSTLLTRLDEARAELAPMFDGLDNLPEAAGRSKRDHADDIARKDLADLLYRSLGAHLDELVNLSKIERNARLADLEREAVKSHAESFSRHAIHDGLRLAWSRTVRAHALEGRRLGGRTPDGVRDITSTVDYLPSNHGSALFTRGDTQALVSVTLGNAEDAQSYETVLGKKSERFLVHYNFPPFSVGEVKQLRGPGRRELGHGALARRALLPVLPGEDALPLTVRVVSDILESNGSSSMATVCGATLALMDAGVPIRAAVAGVAMGLVTDGAHHVVLTDITGDEDEHGEMDLKLAGTRTGLTALQLDNKRGHVPHSLLAEALERALPALHHIHDRLSATLDAPRPVMKREVPHVGSLRVPQNRIGSLIGQGGKHIQELQQATQTRIDVRDDGRVKVFAKRPQDLKSALAKIEALMVDLKVGEIYEADVVSIRDFGAIVRFGDHEGLIHISELAATRVDKVEDVVKVGEKVKVKLLGADDRGRIKLSRRAAL